MRQGAEAQERDWSQWMAAAQAGDGVLYERLLRAVVPFIRSLLRPQLADPDRLEDVVQDVLLCVHRVRHTYDPRRPFTPWLAAVASRRSIDALRRRTRIAAHETVDDLAYETFADASANNSDEADDAAQQLGRLLADLPAKQRQALELLKLKEMSLIEASAASGQSVGSLKVNVHRALKTLKAKLLE